MDESNDPNDQGFATGEDNFSGGFAIVGEPGPELFYIPPGTTIYPNPIAPLTYSLRDHGDRELLMSATMLDGSNYKQVIHFPHDADCIVLKARAMIDAMPHVEAKNERVE